MHGLPQWQAAGQVADGGNVPVVALHLAAAIALAGAVGDLHAHVAARPLLPFVRGKAQARCG